MERMFLAICTFSLLLGCKNPAPSLSLSGNAIWTDSKQPKAEMHVFVETQMNGRNVQLVDDKIELTFPFDSAKFAMDPPDWHQDGEIVGWWYVTPDNPYEISSVTVKAVIEKPAHLAGSTAEKVIPIKDK